MISIKKLCSDGTSSTSAPRQQPTLGPSPRPPPSQSRPCGAVRIPGPDPGLLGRCHRRVSLQWGRDSSLAFPLPSPHNQTTAHTPLLPGSYQKPTRCPIQHLPNKCQRDKPGLSVWTPTCNRPHHFGRGCPAGPVAMASQPEGVWIACVWGLADH